MSHLQNIQDAAGEFANISVAAVVPAVQTLSSERHDRRRTPVS